MSVLTELTTTLGSQPASIDWIETSTPCRSYDPELWFAERPAEVAHAQALCGECSIRVACLAGALERREPWGVWGGELFERGAVVARKRRPGRPRKDDTLTRRAAEAALEQRMTELVAELATDAEGDVDDPADGCVSPTRRAGAAA